MSAPLIAWGPRRHSGSGLRSLVSASDAPSTGMVPRSGTATWPSPVVSTVILAATQPGAMVQLRVARPADAPRIREIYAPVVAETAISFEETPPSVAEVRHRIEQTLERYPWLVCERDGRVVGYASAHRHRRRAAYRWAVDTSVYVDPAARRRGVGRGLYRALFGVLRLQGYVHAYAGTTLPNPASVGLHEAVGFEPVGTYDHVGYKHGAWRSVRWWHRQLRPRPDDPARPVRLAAVTGTADCDRALDDGAAAIRR